MARAVGTQCWYVVLVLLIEGVGDGAAAAVFGVLMGRVATGFELADPGLGAWTWAPAEASAGSAPLPVFTPNLQASLSLQSAAGAWSIGVLAALIVILLMSSCGDKRGEHRASDTSGRGAPSNHRLVGAVLARAVSRAGLSKGRSH